MIGKADVKELLAEGLIEIAKQKPIEKISVMDIVKACDTSRRTFYNHFIDKYDLISWIYTNRVEKVLSCYNDSDSWHQCMINTYKVLLGNADYFLCVIDMEGQNSFYRQFSSHTYDYMKGIISSHLHSDLIPEDIDYALTAHVFGQVNCAIKWIRDGFIISPEQMASYNIQNMPELLKKFFQ